MYQCTVFSDKVIKVTL